MRVRALAIVAATGILAAVPIAVMAGPAGAAPATIDCRYTGPIVGHPGMQYVCYVHNEDGSREVFYAPGPSARP